MNKNEISFIIPALNEERHIGRLIDSIEDNLNGRCAHEVILIDNGSADRTVEIARSNGAHVINMPNCTISSLRNAGVKSSKGEVLVFLDADVYLKKGWGEKIEPIIRWLKSNPFTITGSIYGVSDEAGWIERCWFQPISLRQRVKYINGGHLIISRELFNKLGGFCEDLETGEDYEFCQRGRERYNIRIINIPELRVVHAGYPKTIVEFFRRERWHGRGDWGSLRSIVLSKPALLSLAQAFVLIGSIIGALVFGNLWFLLIYFILMPFLCLAASFHRLGWMASRLPSCAFLYGVYFTARTMSFLDVIFGRPYKKRSE